MARPLLFSYPNKEVAMSHESLSMEKIHRSIAVEKDM
jgi:hypothetical protein